MTQSLTDSLNIENSPISWLIVSFLAARLVTQF